MGYSTYSHRVRAHARARECALPSCSDASEVAVAFTAAPHRATTFAFSATRADIFVVRSENAAASSVFAAASFAFCAVSASILAAHLRRARQDSRRGVERCLPRGTWQGLCGTDARCVAARMAVGARCSLLRHLRVELAQAGRLGEQRSWRLGSCVERAKQCVRRNRWVGAGEAGVGLRNAHVIGFHAKQNRPIVQLDRP